MAYNVTFTPNAVEDLISIVDYIAADSDTRARSFVAELREKIEWKLSLYPEAGMAIGELRFTVFARYVAVYQVQPATETVEVILITEGHRDWQRLLETRG